MEFFVTQVLNGLVYGMMLFLIAAGLSLIFGLMNVVNVAHGSFFMLGAFFALSIQQLTGSFWLALILAPLLPAVIGIAVERIFLRRLYSRGHLDQVLLTFGFTFVFFDAVQGIWGTSIYSLSVPPLLAGVVEYFDVVIPRYRLFLIAFGFLLAISLWLVMDRSRIGAMVRAGVDDAATAEGLGVNVLLLSSAIFAVGIALAALGGVLAGPILGVYPGMDFDILIPAFIVVVIGGLGSLSGAFIGSMFVGLADTFGKAYLPEASLFLIYLAMIAVLLLRPAGLFGINRTGASAVVPDDVGHSAPGAAIGPHVSVTMLLLLSAVLVFLPAFASSYALALVTEILIFAIFAMSLDLLIGYTGLLSFGHAAFFGVATYAVVILNARYGVNPWLGLASGVLLAGLLAAVIGAFCIRVSGIPFLMLTLAFSQLIFSAAVKSRDFTGGTDGMGGLVRPSILGASLNDRTTIFYVCAAFFLFSLCALWRLVRSPLGSVFIGIRENEQRMRALGYRVQSYKLLAFIIAGFFAGVAGGLYALFNGFVSSDTVSWVASGDAIIMVILGGTGTIAGPAVGAGIFLLMRNVLSSYTDHWMMIIGVTFIGCVMFLREGVWGFLQRRQVGAKRFGSWPHWAAKVVPPPASVVRED